MNKTQMFKRVLATSMALAMALSFASCSGVQKNPSAQKSEAPASKETEKTDKTESKAAETITIKVGRAPAADFKFGNGESWDDNAWLDLYKENGINVEVLYSVDPSTAKDKLAQTIASGNYPDIFSLDSASYANYASQNVIADISSIYEKNLNESGKKYLALDGGVAMSSAKIDGKLYGLPALGSGYDSVMLLFIRRDWLKNLNLEMPKTMDEVIKVAEAFTNGDPDKNGKKDTYGLGLNGKDMFNYWGGVQPIFENFGCMPGFFGGNFQFIKDGDKVIWGGAKEKEMIEGLTLLQKMYKDGLIPQDFVTANEGQITQDFTSGKFGMTYAPMWGAMAPSGDALATQPNADFACVGAPIVGSAKSGTAYLPASTDTYYVVSSKCKNPEVLFKLFNLSMDKLVFSESDEDFAKYKGASDYSAWKTSAIPLLYPYQNLNNFEKESKALQSGDMAGLDSEQKSNTENMKYYLDHKADYKDLSPDDFSKFKAGLSLYTVFADPQGGYAALDKMIKADAFNLSAYNGLPTPLMAEKYPVLDKTTKEFIINVIVGNKKPEDYKGFLESWYAQGGTEITKEANEWASKNAK